jgi:chorismate synthase
MVWRHFTAGESHGPALVGYLEGVPAGLALGPADIDPELARRQLGHGRGARMKIEKDHAEIVGGVRFGRTTGAPVALLVRNRGTEDLSAPPAGYRPLLFPRPGHADLAAALKYDLDDIRDVLERASARETAARVALGACAKKLLAEFGIVVHSLVEEIGGVGAAFPERIPASWRRRTDRSPVRCPDAELSAAMVRAIDEAAARGDSLGGVVRVEADGVPPGLGSHTQWDQRIEGRIAGALMALPGVKGVESGLGFAAAARPGSLVHDAIYFSARRPFGWNRRTNRAGGIEGGITNGETVRFRVAMKPIPTLRTPLASASLRGGARGRAAVVRADVCAVPALGVVAEAALALELAGALREKLGGDSLREMRANLRGYLSRISRGRG